jgi:D-tyrosyl-tRNA(Tyr) deacylase
MKRAVYFFCMDDAVDPVASKVFGAIQKHTELCETGLCVDGFPVLEYCAEHYFQFVRLGAVLSHDYTTYLSFLNERCSNFDVAGIVNWHEGKNAPDKILTVHSTGDTASGCFGKANPAYFKNLIRALEEKRIRHNLTEWRVMTEATHWSGIPYKQPPELLTEYSVPVYDIEIGSTRESWNNETAIRVVAESLFEVFNSGDKAKTLLCVGGIHFEEAYTNVLLEKDSAVSIGHILANQWLVENYSGEAGIAKLRNCIESIAGGINGIIFHDNLKGEYKQLCRDIAAENKLYAGKHKILKSAGELKKLLC